MIYRVCKSFHVESGHMLSKHPGLCRHPHGHSRRIDVVLWRQALDTQEMVCDFKALKLAMAPILAQLDHAMAINSRDPARQSLETTSGRLVIFEDQDPTTEVLARWVYQFLSAELAAGKVYRDSGGVEYRFPDGVRLERVRVSETASTWAEYGTT
ncbi:MAG: 6-pyruvoyl tetrahydropterin synthase [Planctomyces sp.]|nr:6-pyruvoyl tetrahydropterin synthase [Planctomyces sp.]MBA4119760.1 6-pyruvoyl tetrahydropterin synthase [Isosphaera sp.]